MNLISFGANDSCHGRAPKRRRKESRKSTSQLAHNFFKLMCNAVFGKTIENKRKRVDFELVNKEERFQKLVNYPSFAGSPIWMNDSLCGVMRNNKKVYLDKPVAVGFCI